jgi:hypothetical protein
MFDALAAAVDDLKVPVDSAALAELFAIRDRLDAHLTAAVGAFDAAELWDLDGQTSMAAWLRHRTGRDHTTSTKLPVRARKLGALPVTAAAALDGTLSAGQVEVILANVPGRHLDRFATDEAALLPVLADLGVDDLRTAMLDWRAKADALDDEPADPAHDSEVYFSKTIDGRGELRGSLGPDLTAVVDAALRVADPDDFDLTGAERRADALATIFRHFLDHQQEHRGGRHRPHLNVVVTLDELHALEGGRYLDTGAVPSPAELGALACDAAIHRVLVDSGSTILDYGRAARLVPPNLYQALVLRDGGCREPGCNRPAAWCDAHHVTPWEQGGETSADNSVLGCRRHHHKWHSPGYSTKLLPDGTFEVTYPDGHTETSKPVSLIASAFHRRFGTG